MRIRVAHLSRRALGSLVDESQKKSPHESGGILVGRFDESQLFASDIIGPGPKAMHAPNSFQRDGAFAQQELDRLFEESHGSLDYVGEWHSHMLPVGPSHRDRRSMQWIATNPRYDLPNPVLIIVQRSGSDGWMPAAFQWFGNQLRRVVVETSPDDQMPACG